MLLLVMSVGVAICFDFGSSFDEILPLIITIILILRSDTVDLVLALLVNSLSLRQSLFNESLSFF
jgi:hypothetical protein